MDYKKYLATWQGTQAENKISRLIIAGLIGTNFVLGIYLLTKDRTVILVPPEISKEMTVSDSAASAEYLESWSWSLAMLLGNVTPDSVRTVKDLVGQVLDPVIYRDVMVALESQVEELKRDRITQTFDPRKITFERQTRKIFVQGLGNISGPMGAPKRDQRVYEFEWRIQGHRPLLTFVTTYTGVPHTQEELSKQEETPAKDAAKSKAAESKS